MKLAFYSLLLVAVVIQSVLCGDEDDVVDTADNKGYIARLLSTLDTLKLKERALDLCGIGTEKKDDPTPNQTPNPTTEDVKDNTAPSQSSWYNPISAVTTRVSDAKNAVTTRLNDAKDAAIEGAKSRITNVANAGLDIAGQAFSAVSETAAGKRLAQAIEGNKMITGAYDALMDLKKVATDPQLRAELCRQVTHKTSEGINKVVTSNSISEAFNETKNHVSSMASGLAETTKHLATNGISSGEKKSGTALEAREEIRKCIADVHPHLKPTKEIATKSEHGMIKRLLHLIYHILKGAISLPGSLLGVTSPISVYIRILTHPTLLYKLPKVSHFMQSLYHDEKDLFQSESEKGMGAINNLLVEGKPKEMMKAINAIWNIEGEPKPSDAEAFCASYRAAFDKTPEVASNPAASNVE